MSSPAAVDNVVHCKFINIISMPLYIAVEEGTSDGRGPE